MNLHKNTKIQTQVIDNYSAISCKKQSLNIFEAMTDFRNSKGWIMVISDKVLVTKELCAAYGIDANRVIAFSTKYTSDVFLTAQKALESKSCAAVFVCKDLLPIDQLEFLFSKSGQQQVHLGLFESKLLAH